MMRETFFCCNIPVDRAAKNVAIIDMATGFLVVVMFGFTLKDRYRGKSTEDLYYYSYHEDDLPAFHDDVFIPWAILICGGIQLFMGILLYEAVLSKNAQTCRIWEYVNIVTCLLTVPFVFRILHMLVIYDFCNSISEEEQERDRIANRTRSPTTQQQSPNPNSDNLPIISHLHQSATATQNTAPPAYSPYALSLSISPPHLEEEDFPPPYHIAITMPFAKL